MGLAWGWYNTEFALLVLLLGGYIWLLWFFAVHRGLGFCLWQYFGFRRVVGALLVFVSVFWG